jgi:hypothetical protein
MPSAIGSCDASLDWPVAELPSELHDCQLCHRRGCPDHATGGFHGSSFETMRAAHGSIGACTGCREQGGGLAIPVVPEKSAPAGSDFGGLACRGRCMGPSGEVVWRIVQPYGYGHRDQRVAPRRGGARRWRKGATPAFEPVRYRVVTLMPLDRTRDSWEQLWGNSPSGRPCVSHS